jgi:two-component system CitB family sensor kinase
MLAQVALLLLIVGSGFGLVALMLGRELISQYEARALAVARAVAADEVIIRDVTAHKALPEVQTHAEAVRRRTGVLFVVVADDQGIRYAHRNPELIGQHVSTDPAALSGREVAVLERGTLGLSARGKVPLFGPDGRVTGQVSVGIDARAINDRSRDMLAWAGLFTGLALAVGVIGAGLLARRLRTQTLGLEPGELSDLLREREAVLHGIDEGVLATDARGRIAICNDAAVRLIGERPVIGTPLIETDLPDELRLPLVERTAARGVMVATRDRMLLVTSAEVRRGGTYLGQVLTLRDRTDLDGLARELDVVRALSDAVRAQAHEYTNRLHTVLGLLELGHRDEAAAYLRQLAGDPIATEHPEGARVRDPYLRGLLAAKTAVASERGVEIRLAEDSTLTAPLARPLDVVTILGNLIDNAVQAASSGARRPAWVEVSVLAEADILHVVVVDSGDGIPDACAEHLFEQGFTTAEDDGRPHGIGLALARQLARRHGGELGLSRSEGEDCGAVFVARLPGTVNVLERAR